MLGTCEDLSYSSGLKSEDVLLSTHRLSLGRSRPRGEARTGLDGPSGRRRGRSEPRNRARLLTEYQAERGLQFVYKKIGLGVS